MTFVKISCLSGQLTDATKAIALLHGRLPILNKSLFITKSRWNYMLSGDTVRGSLYTKDYGISQTPCRFDKDEMSLFYFLVKSDYKHFNDDLLLFLLSAFLLSLLSNHCSRLENSKGLQFDQILKGDKHPPSHSCWGNPNKRPKTIRISGLGSLR